MYPLTLNSYQLGLILQMNVSPASAVEVVSTAVPQLASTYSKELDRFKQLGNDEVANSPLGGSGNSNSYNPAVFRTPAAATPMPITPASMTILSSGRHGQRSGMRHQTPSTLDVFASPIATPIKPMMSAACGLPRAGQLPIDKLEKQLKIEEKVKEGAENLLSAYYKQQSDGRKGMATLVQHATALVCLHFAHFDSLASE